MIINVASENPVKVDAVREVIREYLFLAKAKVVSLKVSSGVSEQPRSLGETIMGARGRAENAFKKCDLSIGLESGLMHIPYAKTKYMDFCACSIYDGREHYLGFSPSFELPPKITKMVIEQGMDVNEAFYESGLTKRKKIGSLKGSIGLLTKGKVTRKDYTKIVVQMALIQLDNVELYR